MLHLLCMGSVASTSVAGGAALSYNQLAVADPAWARLWGDNGLAGPLSSRPLAASTAAPFRSWSTMQLTDSQSELAKWLAERQASGALPDTFTVDWKLENYNPHHGTIKGIKGDQPEIGFATLVALEEAGLVKTVSKVVVPGKKSGATKTGLYQNGWPRHETSRTYTILGPLASFSSPVAQSPSAPERASQQHRHKADFISQDLIDKLGGLQSSTYDLSRLVQYCKEINDNFRMQNFSAVAFLSRAILDHCPPVFGQPNFESVIAHASASSPVI